MKISIALSLLILVIGSMLGWQEHQRHTTMRVSRDRLVAEAAKVGIAPGPIHSADGSRVTKRGRQLVDKEADAKTTAAEFIAFINEMEALEKKGGPPDEATRERAEKFKDRIRALDPAQVKIFIAEARASKDLTDESREKLVNFAVMMHAESGMTSGTAVNDPKLAFKLLAEVGLEDRHQAIWKIANAPNNPEERTATLTALRAYLATLPEGEMRDTTSKDALRTLGQNAVREGFEAGSKWIASTGPDLEWLVVSSGLTVHNYREESGHWIEWIGVNLPVEKSKDSISKMVRNWTETDYEAAGKWLAATPAGPTKTISIRSYAETLAKYEPASAAQWAMTLPPGQDREETLKNIYQKWPDGDDAAKQAFKKSHGIN